MKKITAVIAATILFALSFCSCTARTSVKVNGTKIDDGVYAYFVDRSQVGNPDLTQQEQKEAANNSVAQYVAVNSEFFNRGLELSTAEKAQVSEKVNSYWHLFSAYYENIGVSKQDLYNIEQSKAFREKLMEIYYSADGDNPVTDEQLKEYFAQSFVAFRAITGFLTTVDSDNQTVSLPEADRQKTVDVFNRMANEINEGVSDLDSVVSYAYNVTLTSETVVINADNTAYPDGFFEQLQVVETDRAASFVIGDYIYTVQRFDINAPELDLFEQYRSDCLKALKGKEFDAVVASWSEAYTVSK